jgi:hypothetical protein
LAETFFRFVVQEGMGFTQNPWDTVGEGAFAENLFIIFAAGGRGMPG